MPAPPRNCHCRAAPTITRSRNSTSAPSPTRPAQSAPSRSTNNPFSSPQRHRGTGAMVHELCGLCVSVVNLRLEKSMTETIALGGRQFELRPLKLGQLRPVLDAFDAMSGASGGALIEAAAH